MNRRELVKAVAAFTEQEVRAVEAALRGFETVVSAQVGKGENVVLSGFAKFARVDRKARMGRNPATGEPVKIKASRKARITPLKSLKDIVAGNVAAPKLSPVKAAPKKAAAKRTTKAAPKKAPATRTTKAAPKKAAKKAPATRTTKAAPKKAAKRTAKKR